MQKTKFRGFKLFFEHRESAESMMRQSDDFPSFFAPSTERPLIIDCGTNIGVSLLEWKTRWPGCEVVCFEPDPFAFQVLKRNVQENDLPGVRLFNHAIADHDGEVTFYGDIGPRSDARGNSIDAAWGLRESTQQTTVTCRRLSPFLAARPVDFLKLDIEGAEQRVLVECRELLKLVRAIYVEIHETHESASYNSRLEVVKILSDSGFTIDVDSRHEEHALPPHLNQWRRRVGARQSHVMGWRE